MSIIAWLVLGLIAGFIASQFFSGSGRGVLMDMVLGVVGAFVGGAAFRFFGESGVTGFNIWSLVVATVGATIVLALYRALTRTGNRSNAT